MIKSNDRLGISSNKKRKGQEQKKTPQSTIKMTNDDG